MTDKRKKASNRDALVAAVVERLVERYNNPVFPKHVEEALADFDEQGALERIKQAARGGDRAAQRWLRRHRVDWREENKR